MMPRAQFEANLLPQMISFGYENNDNGFFTALEIIEQMPVGTYLEKNANNLWYVHFGLPGFFQSDYRADECPHIAAAKAFIAWKKGLQ